MDYFKSEADKLIFALLETDGKTRMRLIGSSEELYYNRDKLEDWYNKTSEILDKSSNKKPKKLRTNYWKLLLESVNALMMMMMKINLHFNHILLTRIKIQLNLYIHDNKLLYKGGY